MIASFVLGVGFVGGLHNQAYADTTSSTTSSTTAQKMDKAGRGHGGGFFGGNVTKETATILGVEEATIKASLKEGKTLVEIAEASGLSEADYLQKLIAAETTAINAQVTAGKLKQEQADKLIADLSDRLTKEIENKGNTGGPDGQGSFQGGRDGGQGPRGNKVVEETATILSVDQSAVEEAVQAGKTLAAFAVEKGLTEADYLQKLIDAETASINAEVTAGTITQEQADKKIANLSDHLKQQIEGTQPEGGPGGRPDGHGGPGGMLFGDFDALATILGITADELKTEQQAGKSIAEIAAAEGISEDDLISKLKENLTDSIKKFVENKDFGKQGPDAPNAPGANSATDTTSSETTN